MKHPSTASSIRDISRGFTLIEVLIAVVIFSTALTVLLSFVGTGIGNVNVAKNKLAANYLAQEGIELLRYKRDFLVETAGTPQDGWDSFLQSLNNCTPTSPCGVDGIHPTDTPILCGNGNASCALLVDNVTGAYDNAGDPSAVGWTPSIYTRVVYADGTNDGNYVLIHSIVTWTEGTGTYQVNLSETMYNWF